MIDTALDMETIADPDRLGEILAAQAPACAGQAQDRLLMCARDETKDVLAELDNLRSG